MSATTNNDELKVELNKVLEEWEENRRKDDYNPVTLLTKLSERFEKETEEFHKQDPDPFDDRHPIYTSPNSALGKLMKTLTKQDEFLDVLINKYLKSRAGPVMDKDTNTYQPCLCEAAARLLLTIMPGLDANSVFTDNMAWLYFCFQNLFKLHLKLMTKQDHQNRDFKLKSDIMSLLYRWVMQESETLRTYAAGILANAVEHQDINMHYSDDNATIVPILLKRLWNYIEPGKYQEDCPQSPSTSSNARATSEVSTLSASGKKAKSIADRTPSTRKRRLSDESSARKTKSRRTSEKLKNFPTINEPHVYKDPSGKLTDVSDARPRSSAKRSTENVDLHTSDIVDVSECSNSSWADIAPVVIGYCDRLAPPLSPITCQRMIINLLVPLGEYQDLLSFFIEYKAIEFIRYFLDRSNSNDGLLTFSVLRLLASLLCHNKIATKFIDTNGVQRLLSVRRPSIGATGVSLCIYYLAYNHDAMERVCQLPNKVLVDLVKYATWLLECSHDSGQCHAALFFNISFQFQTILKLFDQRNGLRFLLNMLSMLPIIRLDGEQAAPSKDDEESFRQTAKSACQALKKYFETHLTIKANVAKEMLKITQISSSGPSSSSKVIDSDREAISKHLDFLVLSSAKLPANFFSNWLPIQTFIKLEGTKLLLRLIALTCEWSNYFAKADVVRFALDCLAVVTLSPSTQLELCDPVNLPPNLTEESGISIILGVAEGEAYLGFEPEAQKSALTVIINCVCGPQFKFEGASGKIVNGTPQPRAVCKSLNEDKQKLWECVKTNNGIRILLHLLLNTLPVFHADDIRLLACKALCGLSRCASVKQIMSKLPMFHSGQIQALTKQPVMQDGRKQHKQLCQYIEELTERVSGKPSALDKDLDSLRKAHIVSQTIIRYDNRELLQLVHNHLTWSGLHSTAAVLAKEASLYVPSTSSTTLFSTPKNTTAHRNLGASGDASFSSPITKKISFSRGDHAHGETPTLPPHSSFSLTPNQRKGKKFRFEVNATNDSAQTASDNCKLTTNGKVTVMQRDDLVATSQRTDPPATLNAIVAGYLQNQHAQCKNPVVTVPEFSLLRPHNCPNPRFRVEAPLNVTSRCMRKQVAPRHGGLGGACCDRQLIYSRFRPHVVFRAPDEERVPYTCCAFMPDDMSLVLGNYQGDLTIRGIQTDQDRVVDAVGQAPIVRVEPARDGRRILVVEEGVWRNACCLFSTETMDVKLTYEEAYHVEFSKTVQDKVIGTKNICASIFDAESGQKILKLERADLASHYTNNKATFSPDDDLVLSDGLLWDIRASGSRPIHKFDKFNASVSGVFHPQGLEVIINTEIWDLRNYHLLHTVPSIDQCSIHFNTDRSIIYAAKALSLMDLDDIDETDLNSAWTTFMAIDSHHYRPLSVTDTKHKIYDFAVDGKDCHVAVIERQHNQSDSYFEGPSMSLCRLYEVGRLRGEDDEDEQEEEGPPDEDDDNNEDDDLGDDNMDDDDDLDDFSDTGSGSSYDTPSFAVSLSSSSSPTRTGMRRRPRRRHLRGGGYDLNSSEFEDDDDEDDGWSTFSDASSLPESDGNQPDVNNADGDQPVQDRADEGSGNA